MASVAFLKPISDPNDAVVDIVAVHGLNPWNGNNHAESTWTSRKSGKLWLRDFLPHQIPPSRIFLFAYNANPAFSSGNEGVYEQANNLLVKLLVERDEAPDRPLIFICHSLGGLVVKRAIVQAQQSQTYQQLGKSVRGLVFFGTPHRGGNNAELGDVAASIARLVVRTPANSYLEALKSNSFFAEALRYDFRNRQDDFYILSFYETQGTKAGIIVDKESAMLGLGDDRELVSGLSAAHSELCRFESMEGNDYRHVWKLIKRVVEKSLKAAELEKTLSSLHVPDYNVSQQEKATRLRGYIYLQKNEKQECLRSLVFRNMENRLENISFAHNDTCDWLFQTTQFRQWLGRKHLASHNGVLWIKGKPGAGKSTLMKHTLNHCLESFQGHVIAAYFFNSRGDRLEKTFLGMLRSLLHQLLDKDPGLYEHFVPIFRRKWETYGTLEWREAELKEFLLSEMKRYQSKTLFLLIDALDECNLPDMEKVVEFLESLSVHAMDANAHLNICLSSRHYPNISILKSLELVVEQNTEHREDIAKYVQHKLKGRNMEIESGILQKASGIFMWVVIVVAMLNRAYDRGQVEAMQEVLDKVPSDLEEVFQTLLQEDDGQKSETILMLQLVLFSRRPLRSEELYFAVMAGIAPQKLGVWNRSEVTRDDIQRRITSSSRGLIETRQEHGHVKVTQFIHKSVIDFLLRNKRLQKLDPTLEPDAISASHERLRACCMSYIMMNELGDSATDRLYVEEPDVHYPFLQYATSYLLDHAENSQAEPTVYESRRQWLQQPDLWFDRWKRYLNNYGESTILRYDVDAGLLYLLALGGYRKLVKIFLLERGANVNNQGGIFGNALQAASIGGQEEIVRMLLAKGADVKAQGGIFGNALQAALVNGQKEIVTMLLAKGAEINAHGGIFGNPFQASLCKAQEEIITMLLAEGADINAQGGVFGNALQAAVAKGQEGIVTMLLAKGVDINAQGGIFGNALQAAIAANRAKSVAILLAKEIDINAQGGIFGSALHSALAKEEEEIVMMLLKKGVDVNAEGGIFGNALYSATAGEGEEVVAKLLRKGTDVAKFRGYDIHLEWGPPLLWAARNGHEDAVKLLLEKGADVNAKSGPGKMVLPTARFTARSAISFDCGVTALLWAARNGHVEVVRLLLKNGADLAASTCSGETVLHLAALQGHEAMVRVLLENGADPVAMDIAGRTALFLAASKGHAAVVRLLLEKELEIETETAAVESAATEIDPQHIQALKMNCGFFRLNAAYAVAVLHIESLEMNGGSLHLHSSGAEAMLQIERLEMNGGSLYLQTSGGMAKLVIGSVVMNGGSIHSEADGGGAEVQIERLELSGGSFHSAADGGGAKVQIQRLELSGGLFHSEADGGGAKVQIERLELSGGSFHSEADGGGAKVQIKRLEMSGKSSERLKLIKKVVTHGADETVQGALPDLCLKLLDGRTELHMTTRHGNERALPENGGINTGSKRTALHIAVQKGHRAVAQLLLENGANINAKWFMLTAMDLAVRNSDGVMRKLLMGKKIDIHGEDEYIDLEDEDVDEEDVDEEDYDVDRDAEDTDREDYNGNRGDEEANREDENVNGEDYNVLGGNNYTERDINHIPSTPKAKKVCCISRFWALISTHEKV